MEFLYFLFDLALIVTGSVALLASLILFGGADRNARAVVAVACYMILTGPVITVAPEARWPVARQDNAFIGNILLTTLEAIAGLALLTTALIATPRGQRLRTVARGILPALAGAATFTAILLARGPGAWRTGSGQFGADVIVANVLLGAFLFVLMRRGPAPLKPEEPQPQL